jgi:N-acetylmuramoyl-L-alanine amidase
MKKTWSLFLAIIMLVITFSGSINIVYADSEVTEEEAEVAEEVTVLFNPPPYNTIIATRNLCYLAHDVHDIMGVMIHSTGLNTPRLRSYVGPDDGIVGGGTNNWGWNTPMPGGQLLAVHAFVGRDVAGAIRAYQVMPWEIVTWHSGSRFPNREESRRINANRNGYIGIEMCEDNLTGVQHFRDVYNKTVELTAYLCVRYNIQPEFPYIIGHVEGHALSIAGSSPDPEHWFRRHGRSMHTFREDVRRLVEEMLSVTVEPITIEVYCDGCDDCDDEDEDEIDVDEVVGAAVAAGAAEEDEDEAAIAVEKPRTMNLELLLIGGDVFMELGKAIEFLEADPDWITQPDEWREVDGALTLDYLRVLGNKVYVDIYREDGASYVNLSQFASVLDCEVIVNEDGVYEVLLGARLVVEPSLHVVTGNTIVSHGGDLHRTLEYVYFMVNNHRYFRILDIAHMHNTNWSDARFNVSINFTDGLHTLLPGQRYTPRRGEHRERMLNGNSFAIAATDIIRIGGEDIEVDVYIIDGIVYHSIDNIRALVQGIRR